jgi:hypothetical protein
VLTRRQAAHLGIHRNQLGRLLAAGVLSEPVPGVLVMAAVAPSWEQRLTVAHCAGGDHAMASHRSAARLHRLDGFREMNVIELTATRRLKVDSAVCHITTALDPSDLMVIDGIRCTGLARTLTDLGAVVPVDLVERALDDARRRDVSLRWISETARRLLAPGRGGPSTLLGLLDGIDGATTLRGSWFEKVVELMLVDPRIPELVRQFEVRNPDGHLVARPDLAVPDIRLAIEAHSREFHFGRAAECRDEDRDHALASVGWDTLYLGHRSTRRPAETVELVARVIAERQRIVRGAIRP